MNYGASIQKLIDKLDEHTSLLEDRETMTENQEERYTQYLECRDLLQEAVDSLGENSYKGKV
jgi:thiamine kinase-like enzyme